MDTMIIKINKHKVFDTFGKWNAFLELANNLKKIQDSWLKCLFDKILKIKIDSRWSVKRFEKGGYDYITWQLKAYPHQDVALQICLERYILERGRSEPGFFTWGICLAEEKADPVRMQERITKSYNDDKYKPLKEIFPELATKDDPYWIAYGEDGKIPLKFNENGDLNPSQLLWYCEYKRKYVLGQVKEELYKIFDKTKLFIDFNNEIK